MISNILKVNLPLPHLLFYDDDNPALVRNEEVKYYILTAQLLAKIVFYNLLSKSREYNHARGSAPLLMYCHLKGIRVNILQISWFLSTS